MQKWLWGKSVCSISIFSAVGLQLIFAGALQGHVRAWTNLGAKKEKRLMNVGYKWQNVLSQGKNSPDKLDVS